MNAHARRCRRDMLATIAAVLAMASPTIAQVQGKPPAGGPKAVPTAVAEGSKPGAATVRIQVGDRLSGSTVVRVEGKTWLITGTSPYLALMEKAVEPELLAGPEGHRKLAAGKFRFTPSVPEAMCIEWDLPAEDLARSGITPFQEDRWQAPEKGMRLTALRAQGGPGDAPRRRDAPDTIFTVIDEPDVDCANIRDPGPIETEGVPFVPKDAQGTIVGIGVRSANPSDTTRPVGRILRWDAVVRLVKDGKPVDKRALLDVELAEWADRPVLQSTFALLQEQGFGSIKRWWIDRLDRGEWRGTYRSPGGGPCLLAVVPYDQRDQLDLVLNKPKNAGHGEDRELHRSAIIRIASAGDADGADMIVQSMNEDQVVRPSSSRVLFLEVESVPGKQLVLPGAKKP